MQPGVIHLLSLMTSLCHKESGKLDDSAFLILRAFCLAFLKYKSKRCYRGRCYKEIRDQGEVGVKEIRDQGDCYHGYRLSR